MENGMSFREFCNDLRGYKIKDDRGYEVFKYQLYYKRVNPIKILTNKTKYKYERRT